MSFHYFLLYVEIRNVFFNYHEICLLNKSSNVGGLQASDLISEN